MCLFLLGPPLAAQTGDTRYDQALERALALAPDVRLALLERATQPGPERVRRAAGAAGLLRLDRRDLEERARLLAWGLAAAPEGVCAGWVRGTLDDDQIPSLLRVLDDAALERWTTLTVVALRLGLEPARSPPETTEGDVTELVNRIARSLPPGERARMLQTFETPAGTGTREACGFGRHLVSGTLALPPDERAHWLGVLAWFEATRQGLPIREQ